MAAVRAVLIGLGALAVLMGLLWIGQGLGLILWPRESFMLAERKWALYGLLLALGGMALLRLARRR